MSSGFPNPSSSSLFGAGSAGTGSSLFGSTAAAQNPAPILALPAPPSAGGGFPQESRASSSLFGTTTGQSTGSGLFGGFGQQQPASSPSSTPAAPSTNPQTTSLFGTQQPAFSGLFGTQPAPPTAPSTLFPGIQPFGTAPPAQPSPLTLPYPKNTNFADLPGDMQKALTDLEATIQSNRTLSDSLQAPKLALDQLSASIHALESQLSVIETVYERINCKLYSEKYDHDTQQRYCEHIIRLVNGSRRVEEGPTKGVSYTPIYSPPSRDNEFLEFELQRVSQLLMELETTIGMASRTLLNQDKAQPLTPDTLKDTLRSQLALTKYTLTKYNSGPREEVEALRRRYNAFRARHLGDSKEVFSTHVQYK